MRESCLGNKSWWELQLPGLLWESNGCGASTGWLHISCVTLAMPTNWSVTRFLHLSMRIISHALLVAHSSVTESKLVLLTTRQANQPRDKVLGQGVVTLSGKPANLEDGRLVSQRTILPRFGC